VGATPRCGLPEAVMQFTHEHKELYRTAKRFVEEEINPHVKEWEEAGIWPAREVLKKLGALGLLGNSHCGSVPMGIGVVTDMATPALSRFGTHELKKEYLEPVIKGEQVCSVAVSEESGGSDVAAIKTHARKDG